MGPIRDGSHKGRWMVEVLGILALPHCAKNSREWVRELTKCYLPYSAILPFAIALLLHIHDAPTGFDSSDVSTEAYHVRVP